MPRLAVVALAATWWLCATIGWPSRAAGQDAVSRSAESESISGPLVHDGSRTTSADHLSGPVIPMPPYALGPVASAMDLGSWYVSEPLPWTEPSQRADPASEGSWAVPTLHALGLMTAMRLYAAVIWPKPFADTDPSVWMDNYGRALRVEPKWDSSLRAFEWDGDPWPVNVVGHSLFGSELYVRPRICNNSPVASALFTAGASSIWEYVFEANAVHPSGLDLWFTPLAGVLLGEVRFQIWRAADGLESQIWRGIVQTMFDPLGQIERALGAPC